MQGRESLLFLLPAKQRVIIPFLLFLFSLSVASFRCAPCTELLLLLLRRLCSDFLRLSQLQVSAPLGNEAQPASVTLTPLPSLDAGRGEEGEKKGGREVGGSELMHTRALKGTQVGVVQQDPPPPSFIFIFYAVASFTVTSSSRRGISVVKDDQIKRERRKRGKEWCAG